MARKSSATATHPEDATKQHNIGERKQEIVNALQRLYALDCEIAAIVESDIKELRDEKSDIKTSLRERFGLTNKMIQARYYSYRIERDAAAANDGPTMDAIRELFEALPTGGQGSFLEALGDKDGTDADSDEEVARALGHAAGKAGKNLDTCPYAPAKKKLRASWESGWEQGQLDNMPAGPKGNGSDARA